MLIVSTLLYVAAATLAHAETPDCPKGSQKPECVKKTEEHPKPQVERRGNIGRHGGPKLMPVKKDSPKDQPVAPPPPPSADGQAATLDQAPEHKDGLEPDLNVELSTMKKKDSWPLVNYIGFEWGLKGETKEHREKVWAEGSFETRVPLSGPAYDGGKAPAAELSFDFTALSVEPKLHPNSRVSVLHVILQRDQENGLIYDGHVYIVGASYAHDYELPFAKAFISLNPYLAGYRVLHVINEGVINAASIGAGSVEGGLSHDFFHKKLEATFAYGMSGDLSYGRRPVVGQSNFFGNTTRYWRVELGKKGAPYSFEFSEETNVWRGINVLPDAGFRGGVSFDPRALFHHKS